MGLTLTATTFEFPIILANI
jgi:hypothetical protein